MFGNRFEDVVERRMSTSGSRREFLRGLLALGAASATSSLQVETSSAREHVWGRGGTVAPVSLGDSLPEFSWVAANREDRVVVPNGYDVHVLVRWGDPVGADAPAFDIEAFSAAAQAKQFGFNCDYVACLPFGRGPAAPSPSDLQDGRARLDRLVLFVNHEYSSPKHMFRDYVSGNPTREQVAIELAAHGASILELERLRDGRWSVVRGSMLNRRISGDTLMELTGPAAGHPWLRTSMDATGRRVRGTFNNCAGGKTPWGTILTCEENFDDYFGRRGALPESDPRADVHQRYGVAKEPSPRAWERHHARFDVGKEPNEPFRFGWVVEIDPYDPSWRPRKRTAMGRTKHEAATPVLSRDGRVVVYSGDDEVFQCLYKFVSARAVDMSSREANFDLLDEGVLYVARFDDDGTGEWLPLQYGDGVLTKSNSFSSQADVLLDTRRAAELVGGTAMDRPEDVEVSPIDGRVFVTLTKNKGRTEARVDAANPRAKNAHGHVLEIREGGDDHAANSFRWELPLLCGDPQVPEHRAYFSGCDSREVQAISCPDNLAFDASGNLWIATDGMPSSLGVNDGLFVMPVRGPHRGRVRLFATVPRGAECTGPEFSPDGETLFVSVQHPGEGGSLDNPQSDWPDGGGAVPRPAVIAVSRANGGTIGA